MSRVSYLEFSECKERYEKARSEYENKYYSYLETCLIDAGYLEKVVEELNTGERGVVRIQRRAYDALIT